MAGWADVRRIVAGLPEASEDRRKDGGLHWRVKGKAFIWERPLRKSDIAALGNTAPEGDILAVRVPDQEVKEALVAASDGSVFTIPHFDGYLAVLVLLDTVDLAELEELVVEAWLCRAPAKLADAYVADNEVNRRG